MADDDSERDVLTSLPRTRPVRRSAKRGADAQRKPRAAAAARAKPTAASKPATPRKRPVAKSAKPAKPAKSAAAKAAGSSPAPAAARGSSSARGSAAASPRSGNGAGTDRARTTPPKPKRKIPPAGYATPTGAAGAERPGSGDVLVTAVQAAGELTQIGFELARQTVKSALGRLPKP